jgi:uncharacterized protein (TIGR00304 family)
MRIELIFLGVAMIMVGATLIASESAGVGVGGVIFIGPIPIGFGSSPEFVQYALIFGIIIYLISFILLRK